MRWRRLGASGIAAPEVAMLTLFDNAFSPFARKVRMVLEHKGLAFEAIDGLAPAGHARLGALNPRVEVPVLVDGELVVINSSHIVAYLEHRHPERPVYPADPATRVAALAWERLADTLFDAITHDVSNGGFGFPSGTRPAGLLEAAREDLAPVYGDLERTLARRDFLCGEALSIADLALFPHLTAVRFLDVAFDGATHPRLLGWYKRLRQLDVCRADVERTQAFLRDAGTLERPARIVWRGDRIEWLLARGFADWFDAEMRAGRVAWPRR
jgi:glutathione S-transferase